MTESHALVSVIIPAYNSERYLAEAVRSALAQTYRPVEVIVVDDGSTDGTIAVAAGFGTSVRYSLIPHGGAAAARNHGLALARGEFIAFLDSDDLWLEDKLARQMAAFASDPSLDLVFGQVEHFFSPELAHEDRRKVQLPAVMPGLLPSALAARRQAFARVGLFENGWEVGEFISWYLRASELGLRKAVVPTVVTRRRVHQANTVRVRSQNYTDYVRILKQSLDRRRAAQG
jgi:glycosyltransferase involved in cell wall biosynthesis